MAQTSNDSTMSANDNLLYDEQNVSSFDVPTFTSKLFVFLRTHLV